MKTADKDWHVIDLSKSDNKEEWRITLAILDHERKTGKALADSWDKSVARAKELGII